MHFSARVLMVPLLLALLLLLLTMANAQLPECELDTEVEFYSADIDVEGLSDECASLDEHLFTVGFLIQDVVFAADYQMREYREEYMHTNVCPFPNTEDERRKLATRYRYRATGRCQRCISRTTSRFLQQASNEAEEFEKEEKVRILKDICSLDKDTQEQVDRANDACNDADNILEEMELLFDNENEDAMDIWEDAESKVEKCKEQREKTEMAKSTTSSLCKRGYSSKRYNKAEEQLDNAEDAAEKAENYLQDVLEYQSELKDLVGDNESTLATDSAEPDVSTEQAQDEDEYVNRLSSNLASSNTNCKQVKVAMIQKTIAEETVEESRKMKDEIIALSNGYDGNANIEKIKAKAEAAHLKVQEEAVKACTAADLASDYCGQARSMMRGLQEQQALQDELDVATAAVVDSRVALSDEIVALGEMREAVALVDFDPTMSQLEASVKEDEAILVDHLDAVETKIADVKAQLQQVSGSEGTGLEKQKGSLEEEETKIEKVLSDQDKFLISESAFKKDEYYNSVAPDFLGSPPLQYILRSRPSGDSVTVEINWDPQDEAAGSKEEWFRKFGDIIVKEVPRRLKLVYNTSTGGCIKEDAELSVTVVVTELQTMWEQFDSAICFPETPSPTPSPTPPPALEPTPVPTPGAPTTCNVDEANAEACASARANRDRCGDAMDYWERETSNENMSCARIAFERERDCGVCLPPTMTGVDLCGTEACTADVLFTPSPAGGTCGSAILYYVMQQDVEQELACKSVAVEQAACRPCLPLQPQPVCAATCTDAVLNTDYNGNGNTCGSGIAYWLRREPEADACARVANEQAHVCKCCHPNPAMRPSNC